MRIFCTVLNQLCSIHALSSINMSQARWVIIFFLLVLRRYRELWLAEQYLLSFRSGLSMVIVWAAWRVFYKAKHISMTHFRRFRWFLFNYYILIVVLWLGWCKLKFLSNRFRWSIFWWLLINWVSNTLLSLSFDWRLIRYWWTKESAIAIHLRCLVMRSYVD